MWMPSLSSMMRLVCTRISFPVSVGTQVNGPAPLMKDISMQDLLMHMVKTFGNKRNYDAIIRKLYEVQQKEDETVEEYMLYIHDAVMVISHAYLEHLPDHGRDLKKDHFYHGLCPYLHASVGMPLCHWLG